MKRTLGFAAGLLALAMAFPAAAHDGGAGDEHFQRKWEQEQKYQRQWGWQAPWERDWRDERKHDKKKDKWSKRDRDHDWFSWQQGQFNSRGELVWDRKHQRWTWRDDGPSHKEWRKKDKHKKHDPWHNDR